MADNKPNKKPSEKLCPDCKEIELTIPTDVEVGDIIECDNCGAEVEVISVKPLKLRLILEEK
jgi:lysine biosynthesis protein LysW